MPVKLKKDQFTAGDMDFHVRKRFRPSASYVSKFYTTGEKNLEAKYKESNQYYTNYHDKFDIPESKEEVETKEVIETKETKAKKEETEVKPITKEEVVEKKSDERKQKGKKVDFTIQKSISLNI